MAEPDHAGPGGTAVRGTSAERDGTTTMRTRGLFLSSEEPESQLVRDNAFMEVRLMQVFADGSERPVAPGAVMRSGDAFYLRVVTRDEARIYVMYVGPDQQAHLLLPEGDEDIISLPQMETRVPRSGRAIELDEEVGLEQLYVVASRRALQELGDDTLAAVQAARRGARPPAIDTQAATPVERARAQRTGGEPRPTSSVANGAVIRTRGMGVVERVPAASGSGGGSRVIASADEAGVAVVMFPIDHQ